MYNYFYYLVGIGGQSSRKLRTLSSYFDLSVSVFHALFCSCQQIDVATMQKVKWFFCHTQLSTVIIQLV